MNIRHAWTGLLIPCLIAGLAASPLLAAEAASGKTTSAEVSRKMEEAAHAMKNYSAGQRDEALTSAKDVLAEADKHIDHLEQQMNRNWETMSAAARSQARASMKTLRRQRQDLSQSYGELKRSSAKAWDEVKGGFAQSYRALRDSFLKAREQF